ncbi:MAG: hypothetical protein J3R72DRAFT_444679 [Linnemannia gamsii]|nr:MAG: hypothetical protein J3R72DRAFT_444679 [Linnemannia gamsii]
MISRPSFFFSCIPLLFSVLLLLSFSACPSRLNFVSLQALFTHIYICTHPRILHQTHICPQSNINILDSQQHSRRSKRTAPTTTTGAITRNHRKNHRKDHPMKFPVAVAICMFVVMLPTAFCMPAAPAPLVPDASLEKRSDCSDCEDGCKQRFSDPLFAFSCRMTDCAIQCLTG